MEIKEIINRIEGETKKIKTYFEIDNKIYCLILNISKEDLETLKEDILDNIDQKMQEEQEE